MRTDPHAAPQAAAQSGGGSSTVLYEVSDRIATVTLNRPEARNAMSAELRQALAERLAQAEADDAVDVIILTGTDPAFCAGLDLKELGSQSNSGSATEAATTKPWAATTKPLIGAINGVAITGGFELALNCDFLVASEHAKFGDTHARVGIMPGWGLTVLLPQAIGVRRAREMSFTGNFMGADEALAWGLVNHVVAHDELLSFARALAADIVGIDQTSVRQIRSTYATIHGATDALELELRDSRAWMRSQFSPEAVAARREAIQSRGKSQQ